MPCVCGRASERSKCGCDWKHSGLAPALQLHLHSAFTFFTSTASAQLGSVFFLGNCTTEFQSSDRLVHDCGVSFPLLLLFMHCAGAVRLVSLPCASLHSRKTKGLHRHHK